MDSWKENWVMKRKPVFATSLKSDAIPLQPKNALSLESQHDKVTYFLRSRVCSVKEVENQNSFSSNKVKEYYSPTILLEKGQRGHHDGNFHSSGQRLFQKEKASNNSYQSEYRWKEPSTQQKASFSTGKGSAKKPSFTLERPSVLSRALSRQSQKRNLVMKSTSKEYDLDGDPSGSDCNPGSFQECRLALCFDDVQESQENEDLIAPLGMMASSATLPNGMVLQNSSPEQKKNRLQGGSRSGGIKGTDNVVVKDKANVRRGLNSYFRNAEFNIQKKDEQKSSASPKGALPQIIITQSEVTSQKTLVARANVKRRSVIPLTKNIPKYKVKDKLSYSASKVTKFSETKHYQIKSVKKIQKARITASSGKKSRKSVLLDGPKVAVALPLPEPVITEDQHKPVELCNASTNTGIMFLFGKSPEKGLVKEVEMLMEEQEEITRKAQLISDETLERRMKMKSTNLLESFRTSVSPLRRICEVIQEKTSFLDVTSSASESVKETKMETHACAPCDDKSSCFENSNMDISVDSLQDESLGCSILNNTDDSNSRAVKWKHLKLNSRVFQSPTCYSKAAEKGASPDEEKFTEIDKDISPFTEIAGNFERPSLAPMTPHTHHQVSLIKLSLRKQLNQLYES